MKEKKKNRLVKTTVLTLLVAATLLISGAVTGININLNENVSNGQSQGAIGEGDSDELGPLAVEMQAEQLLEHMTEFRDTTQGTIVWDNSLNYENMGSAQDDSAYPFLSEMADDFEYNGVVHDVHWVGGYWNGDPAPFDWRIRFYKDSGGAPGSLHAGPYEFAWDDIDKIDLGGGYFQMNVDIPATSFSGGKYWISIQGVGNFPPQSGWAIHTDQVLLSEAMFKSDFFGYPSWTPASTVGWGYADTAFQLTLKAETDVGVTEIIHPTYADSPGCPCIPVEVKVKNFGATDETDIPVTVEIHENFWSQTFGGDAPDDMPMDISGTGGCTWQYVPGETCYPFAIYPFHGNFFAELNQCGCLGLSYLTTAYPTDLTGDCIDPWLKFYFWHDMYGSDDYMTVEISTDGMNWAPIGGPYYRLCCPDCPEGWQEYRIDLAAYVGQSQVWFRFVGHCEMPAECYNLGLDYVCVFNMEYQETIEIDLDAGEEQNVEFPCWPIECWWCQYENQDILFHVGAWTSLEGDENPGNDGFGPMQTDFIPVWIHVPWTHDVGDKEITEPSEEYYWADEPIEMCQTIKNYGKEPESCFNVYMQVRDLTILTVLNEGFNAWVDNPYGTYTSDDTPVGWEDIGCYYSDYGWEDSSTNYAGGSSPEARLYWSYACYYQDNILRSPAINTAGAGKLDLEYKSYIDWYSGSSYCWMYVEATSDGMSWTDITPWPNPISGNVGPDTYQYDASDFIGPATQIQFRFYGYYFYFDYWYVDDVIMKTYECGDEVYYQDKVCVGDIGVCEEQLICFEDWVPEPPEVCYCGTKDYCIISYTKMLDPPDQNAANDMKQKFVTVEWMHDVALKEFTSPAQELGGALLWDNGLPDGRNGLAGSTYSGYSNILIDDFVVDETWTVNDGHFRFLWNSNYDETNLASVQVFFYEDTGGCNPSMTELATPACTIDSAYTTGNYYFSRQEIACDVSFDDVVLSPGTYYVGFQPTGVVDDIAYLLTAASKGCQVMADMPYWGYPRWSSSMTLWGEEYDLSFQLTGSTGGGGGGELPTPDLYVPCGEQEFCVMIENLGTYDEDATVHWSFYQYTPDKELVDSGSVDISIDAGTEEEVCLFTYTFDEEGVYEVEVEVTIPKDCDLDNNGPETIIVGADCCGPESCFTLDPEEPNGENNWYTTKVTVTAYAWEGADCDVQSGIAKIVYIIDGVEDYIPGDHGTFVIDGDGVHFIEVYAVDNVGNEEDEHHTFEVAIDATDPSVELIFDYYDDAGTQMVDFTAIAADATSGINRVEFYLDNALQFTDNSFPYEWTITWEDAYVDSTFKATAYDGAGNSDFDEVEGDDISYNQNQHQYQQSQQSQHTNLLQRITAGIR
jgi:hypothetical protein